MRAGKLRHYVTVSTSAITNRDEYGGVTDTFTTATSTWASINPLTGEELERAKEVHGEATCEIAMRHTTHAAVTGRITWDGRTFEIVDLRNPEEISEQLICTCKELK